MTTLNRVDRARTWVRDPCALFPINSCGGKGHPYVRSEITKALGVPVLAAVADDAGSAAHLSDGAPRHRKFESAPLIRSVRQAATTLAATLQRTNELVRS